MTEPKKWMAVFVRSRAEKKVVKELENKNITSYLPLQKTIREWSDRKKKIDRVVLPGYLFVYINPKRYMDVFISNHIVSFVKFENKPAIIPEKQIVAMRRIIETDTSFDINPENFIKGSPVRIKHGSLTGIEGEFIEIARDKRFVLYIKQIGFSLTVQIPYEYLEFLNIP